MVAQEQEYFVFFPQGKLTHPQLNQSHGFGQPAVTPPLDKMWGVWDDITAAADPFQEMSRKPEAARSAKVQEMMGEGVDENEPFLD